MEKFKLAYWFEWGGTCLWAKNERARETYGYAVNEQELPISGKLQQYLAYLQAYFQTMLDWDNAPARSPWWTDEDTAAFREKAEFAYKRLCEELGGEYEIEFRLEESPFLNK